MTASIRQGLEAVSPLLGAVQAEDGAPIDVERVEGRLEAGRDEDGRGYIRYDRPVHFFRALSLWMRHSRGDAAFHLVETPKFDTNGVMVDASRNAVPTVAAVKTLLAHMALMGLNQLMLYTEDTFAVEEYPYFGYMRGRYTEAELRACDDYAYALGIEIVPCIQTLAHLTEALKWNYAGKLRDTSDILLVGAEETYEFIERTIRAASKPFRSDRIHIGMDEAHQLGLGRYLELNGYRKRFDMMNEHLKRVAAIAEAEGSTPMIWSDMYFRLGSKTGGYYDLDAVIPDDVVRDMPKNVQLVYWDYYHTDEAFYREFIRKHKAFGSMPVFAGGVWTWNGIAPNYGKTFDTTNAALAACKAEGVREVFATMWGDNGAETNLFAGLAGLQLFAEHGYADAVDAEALAARFETCSGGGKLSDFLALSRFDETPGVAAGNPKESNPSKFLLWQDVLIGLYDFNVRGLPMREHYAALVADMADAAERNGPWNRLFRFYLQLALALREKSDMGLRAKAAYDAGDRLRLRALADELEPLAESIDALRKLHRANWLADCKPFGWEALDIRYGGVLSRLETTRFRLLAFADGEVASVEELEAERLYYDAPWVMSAGTLGRGRYDRIVTAGTFSG
ncbi:beta-N-acetylhexosaminidase [Paenibacillus antri]|uniref:Beta-N-acetylhexosaminidase n=2 Tax=Paenibacillus antri TaxID=2582848 RepID=A0A5R9G9X1_9BACL|nr:beta-N-acetylhexosaminidase [Paenibacillus antri]